MALNNNILDTFPKRPKMDTSELLSIGEFAKISHTTRRTLRWYSKKGLFHPQGRNEKGYRFYSPEQVLEFQVILLLRKFGFSLKEIKPYAGKDTALLSLFREHKDRLRQEIEDMTERLKNVEGYSENIMKHGALVNPTIKRFKTIEILCIEKTGRYSDMPRFFRELFGYISGLRQEARTLTVYLDFGFRPKRAKMLIAVEKERGMKIRSEGKKIVKTRTIPTFKAISLEHTGDGSLVSLLWRELYKYIDIKKIIRNNDLGFSEIEYSVLLNKRKVTGPVFKFEMYRPIK